MSRGLLIAAVLVSLAWGIGVGSLAIHDRNVQADQLGEYIEDNCLSEKHDLNHCIMLRDDSEEESRNSFPIGNVAAVIFTPIVLLWAIIWFVRRRQRKASIVT